MASSTFTTGMLVCSGVIPGDAFKYNPRNEHFLATSTQEYVTSKDDGSVITDTPSVQIGKCSNL